MRESGFVTQADFRAHLDKHWQTVHQIYPNIRGVIVTPHSKGIIGAAFVGTPGSVAFAGASGFIAEDNANLFWDDTDKRLGIGTSTPIADLDVDGNIASRNLTLGSIPFIIADSIFGEDNANLFWNDARNVLEVLAPTANTFIGKGVVGAGNSASVRNVFLGYEAGRDNVDGGRNVFIGYWAGLANTSGNYNTLVGYYASNYLTTGYSNSCFGAYAGQRIIGGYRNTCLGVEAGDRITEGYENTIVGQGTVTSLTVGFRNTCLGVEANVYDEAAQYRIAIGYGALSKEDNLCAIGGMDPTTAVHVAIFENREFRWYDNGNYVGFEAPALEADQIWVLPDADGAANSCLRTNGGGNLSWSQPLGVGNSPTFLGAKIGGATNYVTFDADGKLTLTGTARVIKKIYLNNAAFTKGASAPTQGILGNLNDWKFDIGDDAVMTHMLPADWAAGTLITIKVCWYIDEAYAADKEVQWRVDWSALPHDFSETVDAPTHSGQIDSGDIDIHATAKRMGTSTVGTIAGASLSANDMLGFTLSRIAVTHDNPTADPGIHHLVIEYTSDKLGEAIA